MYIFIFSGGKWFSPVGSTPPEQDQILTVNFLDSQKKCFSYDNKLLNKCYYYKLHKLFSLESSKWVIEKGFHGVELVQFVHYSPYFCKTKLRLKIKKPGNIFGYLNHALNVLFTWWKLEHVLYLSTFQDGEIVWLRRERMYWRLYTEPMELIRSWGGVKTTL